MKLINQITFTILFFSCISLTIAKTENKSNTLKATTEKSTEKSQTDKNVPLATNMIPESVAYGYATNESDAYLQNTAGMITPTYMDRIPIHLNKPYSGIMRDADGYMRDKLYYDGTYNLSAIKVECNVYTTVPSDCVHNSSCGWCGEKSSCINGNIHGPLMPCLRNTFLYTAPNPEWDPIKAASINVIAVGKDGRPQTHIVPEPDVSQLPVNDPYHQLE